MTAPLAKRTLTAAAGAGRVFGSTARSMVLDAAAGIGAAVAGALRGAAPMPATVRVQVLILSDEQGRPLARPQDVTPALTAASDIFGVGAGIRVRTVGVDVISEPAPTRTLDPRRNRGLLLDDVVGHTSFYRRHLPRRGALAVVGDPVTVVIVRSIAGKATGCSLGMSADWVVCQASLFDASRPKCYDMTVLAHELGHALNLPHSRNRGNLMYPASTPPDRLRGSALTGWQKALLHANRHIVPPAAAPEQ